MLSDHIIDCHTHCFPEAASTDPHAWAQAQNESHWLKLVAPEGRPSIQGWANMDEHREAMKTAGVSRSVLLGWYWENEVTCRWQNEAIAAWLGKCPDRFIGYAAIQPNTSAPKVIQQLEDARELGFCGVGELHMGVQGFNSHSLGWQALAEWCTAHNWPVNLHVTEAAGIPQPGSCQTPLNEFVNMAIASPDLRLILAHWGGGLAFYEHNPRLRKILKNVYYDTAASPLLYQPSIFRSIINSVGADKVLYGSDYPLRVYPKRQKKPDMSGFIDSIFNETDLAEAELRKIFSKNFQRLIT